LERFEVKMEELERTVEELQRTGPRVHKLQDKMKLAQRVRPRANNSS
jgi:hypothetical protein